MKVADLRKRNKPPKILIYGGAGTGKTALVGQAGGAYMLDFDEGMRTCLDIGDEFHDLRYEIEFDEYKDENPMKPTKWIAAKQKMLDISSLTAQGKWKFDALIIDSLTGAAQCCQNQVMANANKPLGKPEIQHWGTIVSELENFLTVVTSLKTLVIITAHEVPVLIQKGSLGHPEEDIHELRVLCAGRKLPDKLPWMFDEFWYAKVSTVGKKTNYILSGKKTSYIQARTRSGFITDVIHNEIGLVGILEKANYSYGSNVVENSDVSKLLNKS